MAILRGRSEAWEFAAAHAYMFLFSLRFAEIFWVIYLREKGLSFAAIGLVETVFHIASFSSEVPTGMIADRFGRWTSIAVGRALAAVAAAMILWGKSDLMLAIAFAVQAVSYTCHSGAFDALIYDSLPDSRRHEYTRVIGKLNSTYLLGTALAGLTASALVSRFPLAILYRVAIVVDVIAIVPALLLPKDAPRSDLTGNAPIDRGLVKALRRQDLRLVLLLWGLSSALGTSVVFYGQPLLREASVPLWLLPLVGTLGNLVAIIPTRGAHRIQARLGDLRSAAIGSLLVPGVTLALALVPALSPAMAPELAGAIPPMRYLAQVAVLALYFALICLQETLYPLFSDAANTRTGSANRAAVMSTGSMVFSVAMMVLFPSIGVLGDKLGLRSGLAVASLLSWAALVPLTASLLRWESEKPSQPS